MSTDQSLSLGPYLDGLLQAAGRALAPLLSLRSSALVALDDADRPLVLRATGDDPPLPPADLLRRALSSGRPELSAGQPAGTAWLTIPLREEPRPRYCFCGGSDAGDALAAGDSPLFMPLTDAVREIAGAALDALGILRSLLDEAAEGIVICDLQGNYLDVNRFTCALMGYTREELLLLNYTDILSKREMEKRPIAYDALLRGETIRIERRLRRKDGSEIYAELTGKLVLGDRFLALFRDMSERRAAERALRESEERYRALTEGAYEMIGIHEEGRLIEGNPALAAVLGTTVEKLKGVSLRKLVGEAQWRRVVSEPEVDGVRKMEVSVPREDGTVRYFEFVAKSVPYQGRMVRLIAGRDVTERRLADDALRQLAAERRRLAAKVIEAQEQERLALAQELHDHIGQVLAVLKMDAAWLATHRDDAKQIGRVAERIDGEVDQMLAVVRSLSHKLRPAVLDDLGLDCALETLIAEIGRHAGITFEVALDTPVRLPPQLATAVYRITQEALANIVRHGNASHCEVTLGCDDGRLALRVEHDGSEVSSETLENGVTMGISSMRERTALLDGEFSILPRSGGGTVLQAAIPIAATANPTPASGGGNSPSGAEG